MMHYEGLILIGAGLFSAAGGALNWDWFMNNRKASFFVKTLTRNGARIVYVIIGVVLVVIGLLILLGIIDS